MGYYVIKDRKYSGADMMSGLRRIFIEYGFTLAWCWIYLQIRLYFGALNDIFQMLHLQKEYFDNIFSPFDQSPVTLEQITFLILHYHTFIGSQ